MTMAEIGEFQQDFADEMKTLAPAGDFPVAPAHGIAALALNMALKYHDMGMIKDGQLYQQYKLEGRNIETLHLEHVFETAIKMERFLLGASDRIAKIVVDAISIAVDDDGAVVEDTQADADPLTKGHQGGNNG
jgi:hypothetical protein